VSILFAYVYIKNNSSIDTQNNYSITKEEVGQAQETWGNGILEENVYI